MLRSDYTDITIRNVHRVSGCPDAYASVNNYIMYTLYSTQASGVTILTHILKSTTCCCLHGRITVYVLLVYRCKARYVKYEPQTTVAYYRKRRCHTVILDHTSISRQHAPDCWRESLAEQDTAHGLFVHQQRYVKVKSLHCCCTC